MKNLNNSSHNNWTRYVGQVSGEVPCPLAREIILKNLNRLGQSIEESLVLHRRMEQAVKVWDGMPDQAPDGHTVCTLIEDWESEVSDER